MTIKERVIKAFENKEIELDTLGQISLNNYTEESVKDALERGWISEETANKILNDEKENNTMIKTITVYISYRSKKEYTLVSLNKEENTAVIADAHGKEKTLKYTTLKKTCKKVEREIEVEEPKTSKKTKPSTNHQEVAYNNLKHAYEWIVGGYENSVDDGEIEEMPSVKDLFNEVLAEAKGSHYDQGISGGPAPISMKLAGNQFLRDTLKSFFETNGYEVPEDLTKEKAHRKAKVGPRNNFRSDDDENTITVYAFTGMVIGTFKVEKEALDTITVIDRKNRELVFDKTTGKQINAANPVYANRIKK